MAKLNKTDIAFLCFQIYFVSFALMTGIIELWLFHVQTCLIFGGMSAAMSVMTLIDLDRYTKQGKDNLAFFGQKVW